MRFRLGNGSKKARKYLNSLPWEEKAHDGLDAARTYESKDEAFFDSHAWLDSDCEDDFFSANGDITPPRGSTPNYQISSCRLNRVFSADALPDTGSEAPSQSPTNGKRRLVDLLQENQNQAEELLGDAAPNGKTENDAGGPDDRHQVVVGSGQLAKLSHGHGNPAASSGGNSACSPDATPDKGFKESKACCLPSLVHSLSFRERRKQRTGPAP